MLELGVSPQKIVYSNVAKEEKHVAYAKSKGVLLTTADTLEEVVKIQQIAPEMKILWRLSIKEENPEMMKTLFSGKFGDDLVTIDQATQRFKQIRDLGVRLHGIHFHCGSASQGSPSFPKAIELAKQCMAEGRKQGHIMETLDVGGGFPSGPISQNLFNCLSKVKDDPLGYQVIAEPGRHVSNNTCHLLFRIIAKRRKAGKLCYHVNESLYHSFNCNLMDGVTFEQDANQFYGVMNEKEEFETLNNKQGQEWGSLFGMTCDGRDVIANHLMIPDNMEVGDWMSMGGMGSYTFGPRSKFNGMKSTTKICQWSGEMQESLVPGSVLKRQVA